MLEVTCYMVVCNRKIDHLYCEFLLVMYYILVQDCTKIDHFYYILLRVFTSVIDLQLHMKMYYRGQKHNNG